MAKLPLAVEDASKDSRQPRPAKFNPALKVAVTGWKHLLLNFSYYVKKKFNERINEGLEKKSLTVSRPI